MPLRAINSWFKLAAWKQILIGLILGIIVGLLIGKQVDMLKPIGALFINAIRMIIAPVVFTAIVCAVLSVGNASRMRRSAGKAFLGYTLCMLLAATIGLSLATLIQPGTGFHPLAKTQLSIDHAPSLATFITNLIPANPIAALLNNNVLQIVVLALLFGFAIKLTGKKGEPIANFFKSLNHVVFQLAHIVIKLAPYGIFALIAWTFGHFGFQAIIPLMKFVVTVYLGCILQFLIVYSVGLLINGINPIHFFKSIFPALAFAFTSSSSGATLPLSMDLTTRKLGVAKDITHFLLPLGCNFNLNGLSIYLCASVIFAANMVGIHLSFSQYLTVMLTITLTAMGAGAVPGSALIVMGAVLNSVGLPLGAIGIIASVDRINDMMQTCTNAAGDMFVTTLVGKSEEKHARSTEPSTKSSLLDSLEDTVQES